MIEDAILAYTDCRYVAYTKYSHFCDISFKAWIIAFFFFRWPFFYFSYRYARLKLDKYIKTQKAMDSHVNQIVKPNKKVLVFFGEGQLSPSSYDPRSYIRLPVVKRHALFFKKRTNCDARHIERDIWTIIRKKNSSRNNAWCGEGSPCTIIWPRRVDHISYVDQNARIWCGSLEEVKL